MKKSLVFICLFLTVALSASAQKKVVFNTKYLPGTNYAISTVMDMKMEMDFTGDTAQIKSMKASGMKVPVVMLMNYDMLMGVKTGTPSINKEYAVLVTYDKMAIKTNVNGQEVPVPANPLAGAKMYGKYTTEGNFQLDSLPGQMLDEANKQAIVKMVTDLQNQIKFPEGGIAVGESYTQDIPMTMPVAGKSMEMHIKAIYKLVKIVNGLAYFDVNQSLNMEVPAGNVNMKINGGGDGKVVYSLKNKYISTYDTNLKFSYNMEVTKVTMNGSADMKCKYMVTVN